MRAFKVLERTFQIDARRSRPRLFNRPISGRLQGIAARRHRVCPKIENRFSGSAMRLVSMT
jgi:hypothetical protein